MKKNILAVVALTGFVVIALTGCGGGGSGGAVIKVEPKGGGRICVPKAAGKSASSTTGEQQETMQGSFSLTGAGSGDILITMYSYSQPARQALPPNAEKYLNQTASGTQFFAYVTGSGSSECGDFTMYMTGT
ncbi:MAG: hypothetical protein AB1546_04380, partial [bacterium]